MADSKNIISSAKEALRKQADAINALANFIDEGFVEIVRLCLASKGRVVVSGIGKSAIIAQKMVATLNSTGTPALYMHAADAIHGDLGMVQEHDIVFCISKSGNSPEIKALIPFLKDRGNIVVGIHGNEDSYLAKNTDYHLNTWVSEEICPNNLAPTTSTTAQMTMGDVLAVALIKERQFSSQDFAKHHPGGALGKKLYLKVADLLLKNEVPKVTADAMVKTCLLEISQKRLGATAVLKNNDLVGIITDGDVRRMLEQHDDFLALSAEDIMTKNPKTIEADSLAYDAYRLMEQNNITQVPVVEGGIYKGMIHLHDILKEGIF